MPIPLYFAADCEEIVTISGTHDRALTGYGVFSDGSVRTLIEDVDLAQVECELNCITRSCCCTCIYSCCDIELVDCEVQIYFSTKHFVNIDSCIDNTLR